MKKIHWLTGAVLTASALFLAVSPVGIDNGQNKSFKLQKPMVVKQEYKEKEEKSNNKLKRDKVLEKIRNFSEKCEKNSEYLIELNEKIERKNVEYTIRNYISAIESESYKDAYEMLSSDSKKLHSYKDFVKKNEAGITLYDLKSLKIEKSEKGIESKLNLYQDPASHSISLVKEENKYKITWHEGTPSFPYK